MKKHLIALLVVAIIGVGAYALWQVKPWKSAVVDVSSDPSPALESLIRCEHPVKRSFELRVHWIGTVESQASITLTAAVAGRVEAINAKDQHPVKAGQSLIRLSGPEIEAARARLKAKAEAFEQQIQLAQGTLGRLEENLKAHLATKDQVATAQETKVRLEAQLRATRLNITTLNQQSTVIAPVDGMFTNRQVSLGQDVAAGQVLGDIIDTHRLRIKASLFPPQDLTLPGKKVIIRLNDSQTATGTVQQVLPVASSTGAMTVWIEGPQIDALLHPGQTIGGDIVDRSQADALAVPESAIVYDAQDCPLLFVQEKDDYERVGIQTGVKQDGWVEVLSGVKADQLVVVKGAYELFYRQFNEQFKVQD